MKKFTTGLLNRTKSSNGTTRSNSNLISQDYSNAPLDSPEANAGRGVRLFCESGSMENGGEEVLHLPVIVDAAESSPAAAAAAAQQIRKFLTKEWAAKPYVQYNAIMLIRILSDNPGPSFSRNFDKSFVSTVKEALRNCKDGSTQQILRETLDTLEANKQYQEGMEGLVAMWRKEKGHQASFAGQNSRAMPVQPGWHQGQQRPRGLDRQRSSRHNALPPPMELASRIEEAKNSAKILMQLIQSTAADEVLGNELVREFNERCQSAQRSMQGYINCDNPAPDDDTMLTLIETNEQLSLSSSRYQRAILTARRNLGVSASPGQETMAGGLGTTLTSDGTGSPAPHREENQSGFAPSSSPPLSTHQQQYYSQSGGISAFAPPISSPGEEVYRAPPGPPPQRSESQKRPSAFAEPKRNGSETDYRVPSNPPPELRDRLNSREETYALPSRPPPQQQQQPQPAQGQSNPFADPAEYESNPAPLAFEPTNYGNSSAITPTSPSDRYQLPSQHQRFDHIPEESSHDSAQQNLYNSSPKVARRPVSSVADSEARVSPNSPERQRGWPSQDAVSEIDGNSEVGRADASREERGYRS